MKTAYYILFSGGYDSSFVTMSLLDYISYNNKKDEEVDILLISIDGSFTPGKNKREKIARDKLMAYWISKYPKINFKNLSLKVDTNNFNISSANRGLSQILFWLPSLITSVDLMKCDNNIILFSYILIDQESIFINEIENIVRNSLKITCMDKFYEFKNNKMIHERLNKVDIQFPIIGSDKETVLYEMICMDKSVFEKCTTCESYNNHFCGKCKCCTDLKRALNNIATDDNYREDIRQYVKEYIDEKFNYKSIKEGE